MKLYKICACLVVCWSLVRGSMYEQFEQQDEEQVSSSTEVSRPVTRAGLARLLGSEGFKAVIQYDMSDQELFRFLNSTYAVRYDQASDFFFPLGRLSSLSCFTAVASDIEHKNFVYSCSCGDDETRILLIGTRDVRTEKRLRFFIEEVGIVRVHEDGKFEVCKNGFLHLGAEELKMLYEKNYVYEPFIGFHFDDSNGERRTMRLLVLGTRERADSHVIADYLKTSYLQY